MITRDFFNPPLYDRHGLHVNKRSPMAPTQTLVPAALVTLVLQPFSDCTQYCFPTFHSLRSAARQKVSQFFVIMRQGGGRQARQKSRAIAPGQDPLIQQGKNAAVGPASKG
jgi:hypothetical protein